MTAAARILSPQYLRLVPLHDMAHPDDEAASVLSSFEARVIDVSLRNLANETKRNSDAVLAINDSLRVLTRLEQAQGDVLDRLRHGSMTMTEHDKRLKAIEVNMPSLMEMRRWVVMGILAGVGMIGIALFKLVVYDVPRIPGAVQYVPVPAPVPAPAASR